MNVTYAAWRKNMTHSKLGPRRFREKYEFTAERMVKTDTRNERGETFEDLYGKRGG